MKNRINIFVIIISIFFGFMIFTFSEAKSDDQVKLFHSDAHSNSGKTEEIFFTMEYDGLFILKSDVLDDTYIAIFNADGEKVNDEDLEVDSESEYEVYLLAGDFYLKYSPGDFLSIDGYAAYDYVRSEEEYEDEDFDNEDNSYDDPPTYSELSKILKKYKGKKNFLYDTIDVGNKCRLYTVGCKGVSTNHLKTQGYASALLVEPYIEICKKKDRILTRICIKGIWKQFDVFDPVDVDDIVFKIRSNNRKITYSGSSYLTDERDFYNHKGWYECITKGYVVLSDSDIGIDKIFKKFKKIVNQKSMKVRMSDYDGGYYEVSMTTTNRKYLKKLIKIYEKLLSRY